MNAPSIEQWLRSGHGRAATLILRHGLPAEYRAALEYACTHYISFDIYEENRAPYLLRLIDLAGEREYFRDFAVRTLRSGDGKETEWQLCLRLARLINADVSDPELVEAMYTAVERVGTGQTGIRCLDELVHAGGADGFHHAIRACASHDWEEDPEDVHAFRHFVESATEILGEPALAEIKAEYPFVEHKLELAKERSSASDASSGWRGFRRWLRAASEAEIRTRFESSDEADAVRLIRAFGRHFFSWDDTAFLIPIAEDDPRPKIRRAAVGALSERRGSRIRQLAMRLWYGGRMKEGADLLVSYPSARDVLMLDRHIRTLTDRDEIHNFAYPVRYLLESNPRMRGGPAALRYLYEAGPCSYCRVSVVRLLNLLGKLPDAWRHECRYDAYSQVPVWARPRYRHRRMS